MSTTRFFVALAVLATAICSNAQATHSQMARQEMEKSHKYIHFGDGVVDSVEHARLIRQFYTDQFTHAQDPQAPYFLLMSRDSKIAMGIGGVVKAIASYDWHGMIDGDGFDPYEIPIPMNPANINAFQTSIGNSSIFFTVFGRHDKVGLFKFYIQADFAGGASDKYFRLKKAYAIAGDWTFGYAKSTFSDPSAQPSTVETTGPNSEADGTRMLIRYMHPFNNGITLAASIENPHNSYYTNSTTEAGNVYMPDFSAFLQWSWANAQHIRLAGIVKGMRYRDLIGQRNRYVTGWGISLNAVANPTKQITLYGSAYTGQGIGSAINDLANGKNDMVAITTPGLMKAPRSYGWYAALQYHFSPRLFTTLIASQERILPSSDMEYAATDYKYGLYGTANIFFNITQRWQIGAEFNIGKRSNMDGSHRLAYRAGCLAQFSF